MSLCLVSNSLTLDPFLRKATVRSLAGSALPLSSSSSYVADGVAGGLDGTAFACTRMHHTTASNPWWRTRHHPPKAQRVSETHALHLSVRTDQKTSPPARAIPHQLRSGKPTRTPPGAPYHIPRKCLLSLRACMRWQPSGSHICTAALASTPANAAIPLHLTPLHVTRGRGVI
jgi:hypothetical protein